MRSAALSMTFTTFVLLYGSESFGQAKKSTKLGDSPAMLMAPITVFIPSVDENSFLSAYCTGGIESECHFTQVSFAPPTPPNPESRGKLIAKLKAEGGLDGLKSSVCEGAKSSVGFQRARARLPGTDSLRRPREAESEAMDALCECDTLECAVTALSAVDVASCSMTISDFTFPMRRKSPGHWVFSGDNGGLCGNTFLVTLETPNGSEWTFTQRRVPGGTEVVGCPKKESVSTFSSVGHPGWKIDTSSLCPGGVISVIKM